MGCCSTTFLILLCLIVGLLLGVYLSDKYDISGLDDLQEKLKRLFREQRNSFTSS